MGEKRKVYGALLDGTQGLTTGLYDYVQERCPKTRASDLCGPRCWPERSRHQSSRPPASRDVPDRQA